MTYKKAPSLWYRGASVCEYAYGERSIVPCRATNTAESSATKFKEEYEAHPLPNYKSVVGRGGEIRTYFFVSLHSLPSYLIKGRALFAHPQNSRF